MDGAHLGRSSLGVKGFRFHPILPGSSHLVRRAASTHPPQLCIRSTRGLAFGLEFPLGRLAQWENMIAVWTSHLLSP
jgi:hypothetical protein